MKKKILLFLLILIISVTPVISSAETYEIVDGVLDYNYHVAAYNGDSYYYIFCFNEPDQVKVYTTTMMIPANPPERPEPTYRDATFIKWKNQPNVYVYRKNLSNGVWNEYDSAYGEWEITRIVGSNINVKHVDGTVFFSPPEPPVLTQAMEGVHSGMILKTILAGLTHLVGFLVLVICFRKGWAFLRHQLTT